MSNTLANRYRLGGRFRRSMRLDTDSGDVSALNGFVLHPTAWATLMRVLSQGRSDQQRAFTWTGPYGSGKSSLAVILSALFAANSVVRRRAERLFAREQLNQIRKVAPIGKNGWIIVPVVGQREAPEGQVEAALRKGVRERWPTRKPKRLRKFLKQGKSKSVIQDLIVVGEEAGRTGGGLLLILDEMGKVLEHLAQTGGDLNFFQNLAEAFSRTEARCAFVGILHQAFQEYATQLGAAAQKEWAKVQGRFVDIPHSITVEEVTNLVGRAIDGPKPPALAVKLCKSVANSIPDGRLSKSAELAARLARCWPLHPVAALLLGPLSRTRFGQNERSTFSFLASGEPAGFQDFLLSQQASSSAAYTPDRLWDYLQLNLEPAILASPDSHRWAEAAEAIERTRRKGEPIHVALVKSIALLDLFGRAYGLTGSNEILATCLNGYPKRRVLKALSDLETWSVAIFRRHVQGWGLYAGSDINLEEAIAFSRSQLGNDMANLLAHLPTLPPIVAKRHYHNMGTLRWFDARISASTDLTKAVGEVGRGSDRSGSFVLVVPDKGEDANDLQLACRRISREALKESVGLAFGVLPQARRLKELALEVAAMEKVKANLPALEGDAIARRELYGRLNAARIDLREAVRDAFQTAVWIVGRRRIQAKGHASLSRIASDLADRVFHSAPVLRNELVNRDRPSSNAVAARRVLMHRMALHSDKENLGIEGYPAEYGLYVSVLKGADLHQRDPEFPLSWRFAEPKGNDLSGTYAELWHDGACFLGLTEGARISVEKLYERWQQPPFGLRAGVVPILALAFILAKEGELAVYVDNVFTPTLDDFFVDRLLQNPADIAVRRFRIFGVRRKALHKLAEFVAGTLVDEEPTTALAVAKPLVQFAHRLRPWVMRTSRLSPETVKIRNVLLGASDPYALLFEDLPNACGSPKRLTAKSSGRAVEHFSSRLQSAVSELRTAYEVMLEDLTRSLADSLGLDDASHASFERLKERAEQVAGVSGDFRLDAFARRISTPKNGIEWAEGLASLAANKPPRDWADADLDRGRMELTDLAIRFRRVERLVAAKSRKPGAFCLTGAVSNGRETKDVDFACLLPKKQKDMVIKVAEKLREALDKTDVSRNLRLAVIAQILNQEIASTEVSIAGEESVGEGDATAKLKSIVE